MNDTETPRALARSRLEIHRPKSRCSTVLPMGNFREFFIALLRLLSNYYLTIYDFENTALIAWALLKASSGSGLLSRTRHSSSRYNIKCFRSAGTTVSLAATNIVSPSRSDRITSRAFQIAAVGVVAKPANVANLTSPSG